ncbi:MAG TPA: ABC transporter ATP-binding protein [Thermomicrobiales bacterium]|nr:ABC transporter ATP-binding protein [Thermomicrobiales bacterium]
MAAPTTAPPPAPTTSPVTGAIIETRGFTKRYGKFLALDNITLSIPSASVGLLGANGAGKSTLIRSLLGVIKPSGGEAKVVGFDTRTQGISVREHVGYMPEADALPMATTAADFVGHMAEMSGLPPRQARQRAADVLYQVGLGEERYRLIKGFSTGMRQRVKLAQAIVHDPKLVFLDEPTAGMDPQGRDEMLELVERIYRSMGISVVFSSHILEDIEKVCDYVVILDGGRLVASQPLGDVNAQTGEIALQLESGADGFAQALAAQGIEARPYESETSTYEQLLIRADGDHVYDAVRDIAVAQHAVIRGMRSQARSLEDIYLGNVGAAREEHHVD